MRLPAMSVCLSVSKITSGKSHVHVLRMGIWRLSQQRRVVLRHRNTVVGGKCALPSALLVLPWNPGWHIFLNWWCSVNLFYFVCVCVCVCVSQINMIWYHSRKPTCDFLIDFHCHYVSIFISFFFSKICFICRFFHPTLVWSRLKGVSLGVGPRVRKLVSKNRVPGLPSGENCVILRSLVFIYYYYFFFVSFESIRACDGQMDGQKRRLCDCVAL